MPMQNQNVINNQLFGRLNTIESKVDETNGYLKGHIELTDRLFALLDKRDKSQTKVVCWLIGLLLFSLLVIAYGAIGKEGLHSVRQTLPTVPVDTRAALPAHNDFDKYAVNQRKEKTR